MQTIPKLNGTKFLDAVIGSDSNDNDAMIKEIIFTRGEPDDEHGFYDFEEREDEVMELLHAVDIKSVTVGGFSLLHLACLFGSRRLFDAVIADDEVFGMRTADKGYSPLHCALMMKNHLLVKLLVEDPRTPLSDLTNDQVILQETLSSEDSVTTKAVFTVIMRLVDDQARQDLMTKAVQLCEEESCMGSLFTLIYIGFLPTSFVLEEKEGRQANLIQLFMRNDVGFDLEYLQKFLENKSALNVLDKHGKTALDYACSEDGDTVTDEGVMAMLTAGCEFGPLYSSGRLLNQKEFPRSRQEYKKIQIAKLFSTVVLVSDGYLCLPQGEATKTTRFFAMAQRLPIELQMMLCNRAFRSQEDIIHSSRVNRCLAKMI